MAARKNHYVDNKAFLEAFKTYLPIVRPLREKYEAQCKKLLKQGMTKKELPSFARPQTPEYDFIGECFLKIAEHLSRLPDYFRYTFKEEMIGDAIENAVMYMENFDPEKSSNPFAYFTQIMTYAFWRRCEKEDKHAYIKQKSLEAAADFYSTQGGDSGEYTNTYVKFVRDAKSDIIKNFEERKQEKKDKTKKANLDNPKKKKVENQGVEQFMVPTMDTTLLV